jgi:hypothetical protein
MLQSWSSVTMSGSVYSSTSKSGCRSAGWRRPQVGVDGDRHPVAGAPEQVLDDGAGRLQGDRQGAGVHRHRWTGWRAGPVDDRGEGLSVHPQSAAPSV